MNKQQFYIFIFFLPLLWVATSCREDELVVPTEYDIIPETPREDSSLRGLDLVDLSFIHIPQPTRQADIPYARFLLEEYQLQRYPC